MRHLKTFAEHPNTVSKPLTEAITETADYEKKFAKKIQELTDLIDQAKKDDVNGLEVDSTWESMYQFHKIWIEKNKLKCTYTEFDGGKTKEKTDTVNLKTDETQDWQETKHLFSWIKRCINKGYRQENKRKKKEDN